MASKKQLETYKEGISKILSYLMDRAKVHFESADYNGYVDEMPFFTLHVYLKKAVYEHLVDMVLKDPKKYIDSSLSESMAHEGVSVQWLKKEIGYKRKIKSFVVKREYTFFDLETYHKYVSSLELFLFYTSFRDIVFYLYAMTIYPYDLTMEEVQEKLAEEVDYFSQYESFDGLWIGDWVKEEEWNKSLEEEAKDSNGESNGRDDSLDDFDKKCLRLSILFLVEHTDNEGLKATLQSLIENIENEDLETSLKKVEDLIESIEDEAVANSLKEIVEDLEYTEPEVEKKEPYGVLNECGPIKDSLWYEDTEGDLGLSLMENYIPTLTDIMCKMFWKIKYSMSLNRKNRKVIKGLKEAYVKGDDPFSLDIYTGGYKEALMELERPVTRTAMLPYVTKQREEMLDMYETFLDRVLEVLQSPLFKLPLDFSYEVLKETYEGMYSLYFYERANEQTRGKNKVCSREDMVKHSGLKKDAFTERVMPYGASFTNAKIKWFEKELGLSFEHRIED